jgi:SAM-dependent methyltransferase
MAEGEIGYEYQGSELALFAKAQNWKRYIRDSLRPFVRGRVAEVGAGFGATTEVLSALPHDEWVALEPDEQLLAKLKAHLQAGNLKASVVPRKAFLDEINPNETFDTIIYIDVLEHIEDDKAELERAARRLRPDGSLIILSPAYQSLYTPFDASIGHFRRYTLAQLKALDPPGVSFQAGFYLDSIGALTSVANRLFLKQSTPTARQIHVWDHLFVPCSRVADPIIGRSFGRSVVAVWKAAASGEG